MFSFKTTGEYVGKYDLINQLPDLKEDYHWIKDVPSQSLQSSIERLDTAYKRFFRTHKSGGGYPRFASKKTFKSILFKKVSIIGNAIKLPKLGIVKIFKDSEIKGCPKTAQVIIKPNGYFINIQCEDVPLKFNNERQVIGLDMGISHFCIDSNGVFIENPKHFKKYERKLKIENRSLSRKKRGSNSWVKQCKKLSKIYSTISNSRKDFLHKESTKIAKKNHVVYMEDLKVSNMAKNTRLSKHILDCGWGTFRAMLEYKATVVRVDPRYTSQTCFECGAVDKKSRLNQAHFCCTSCGHISNADINAAQNIKRKGIALSREREAIACALALEVSKRNHVRLTSTVNS